MLNISLGNMKIWFPILSFHKLRMMHVFFKSSSLENKDLHNSGHDLSKNSTCPVSNADYIGFRRKLCPKSTCLNANLTSPRLSSCGICQVLMVNTRVDDGLATQETSKPGVDLLIPEYGGVSTRRVTVKPLNIWCTKSQNLNVSPLVLQLSLPNPLKSRMKM